MRVGFSSNAFSNTSIFHAIESLSKIGYDAIEIVLDSPHAFLPMKGEEIKKIEKCIYKNEFSVCNLNSNTVSGSKYFSENPFEPSLSNINTKLRNWRISYTRKAIDFAVLLDAPSISITSGILDQANYKTELTFFKESLRLIGEYAEQNNILLAIEYEPGLLVGNSESVWDLISDFNNIGLNFDTCHAAVLNENFSELIQKFKKKIFHTHISDCKNNIHFHLLPGLGEIDFEEFYSSLKEIGYDGFLTAELYPYSDNPEEAASNVFIYMKNLMR